MFKPLFQLNNHGNRVTTYFLFYTRDNVYKYFYPIRIYIHAYTYIHTSLSIYILFFVGLPGYPVTNTRKPACGLAFLGYHQNMEIYNFGNSKKEIIMFYHVRYNILILIVYNIRTNHHPRQSPPKFLSICIVFRCLIHLAF